MTRLVEEDLPDYLLAYQSYLRSRDEYLVEKGLKPPSVLQKLTEAVKIAMESPNVRKSAETAGVEIRYMTPAQLDSVVRKDIQYWSNVIKTANIRAD
mgnify:CR=1 FL=1